MKSPIGSSSPCDVQASGAIELLFYGELARDERHEVESHLTACAECRGALDELEAIREALSTRPVVAAPPGGDWTSLMSRIDAAIADEVPGPAQLSRATSAFGGKNPAGNRLQAAQAEGGSRESVSGRRHPIPAYFALAAMLTLVTASVTYLARHQSDQRVDPAAVSRVEQPSAGEPPVPAAAQPAAALTTQADPFAAVSEQHFERSKLVILGLASRDPYGSSSSDWSYERQLAGALLDDTRLYKQAAQARGLESLAGVMSDLELVLLQASLSNQQDAASLDRLQRLIRKRDLVSKMEMTRF
jgi:anti-sigma factor RsiW